MRITIRITISFNNPYSDFLTILEDTLAEIFAGEAIRHDVRCSDPRGQEIATYDREATAAAGHNIPMLKVAYPIQFTC